MTDSDLRPPQNFNARERALFHRLARMTDAEWTAYHYTSRPLDPTINTARVLLAVIRARERQSRRP